MINAHLFPWKLHRAQFWYLTLPSESIGRTVITNFVAGNQTRNKGYKVCTYREKREADTPSGGEPEKRSCERSALWSRFSTAITAGHGLFVCMPYTWSRAAKLHCADALYLSYGTATFHVAISDKERGIVYFCRRMLRATFCSMENLYVHVKRHRSREL